MSPTIHLGPLALAGDRLLAVGAIWLFIAIGSSRRFGHAGSAVTWAAVAGVVAARLAYILGHWADFRVAPLSTLAVWEGGFNSWAGVLAATLVLIFRAKRQHRARLLVLLVVISTTWFAVDRAMVSSRTSPFAMNDFQLTATDGRPFDPRALEGRPIVINLWAAWCPPCRREMPLLAEVAKANPGVSFLFVNQGDTAETALRLPKANRMDERGILLDPGGRMSAAYGGALPTTIFIDARGTVRSVHQGAISRAALSDQLNAIKGDQ